MRSDPQSHLPHERIDDPIANEKLRGFNVMMGFRIAEWRDDFARIELAVAEKHLNRSGVVQGGVLATMLDVTLGYCGLYTAATKRLRRAVTLTMTMSYLGQAHSGTLTCKATKRGGGNTIFMATGEVLDENGKLIAMGEGTFRYIADKAR
jgi:uncharacterized protein (TIGR00369 family)